MLAQVLAILTALAPILKPALAFVAGWLFPSPIQKAQKGIDDVHDVEKKVSEGTAPTSDLDRVD